MTKRTIECYICEKQETERSYGYGWPGWGSLQGKKPDNEEVNEQEYALHLCPNHIDKFYGYAERLKNGMD